MKNPLRVAFLLLLPLCLFSTTAYSNSVAELERIASQAKTLEEFLGSTIVKEQYFSALKSYQHRDRFRCESFDKILAKVKTLSEKVPGFSKAIWEKTSASDIEVTAYRPIDDKKNSPFLPDRFLFRGVPRRFHALWNDPSLSGCYSDACNEDDTAMPDRWSVALQGSELYYVEKNGIFADQSVLFLPLKRSGKDYRLIVVGGGPALLKEVDIWNGGRNKSFRQSLAQTLAQRLQKSRWKDNRQELLINKTERNLASTDKKAESPFPVDEFTVSDNLGDAMEKAMPRKCLDGSLKSLTAALGKKRLPGEAFQKFPLNGQLNPAFQDISAVSKMAADGSLLQKLPEASTLNSKDKELVDSQLMKVFLDPRKDASTRARAGVALNQFNSPDFSSKLWNRSNPYKPVALNPKEVKADLAAAFNKSLHDPNAVVRATAALGSIDSIRPIPDHALTALENSFKPTESKKIAQNNPEILDRLLGAADRAGTFSPDLSQNLDRPNPRISDLERLRLAMSQDKPFGFREMNETVLDDVIRAAKAPDSRRDATDILTKNLIHPPPGGAARAQIQWLGRADLPRETREMIYDSLRNISTSCAVEKKLRKHFKDLLPDVETTGLEQWLNWVISPALADVEHTPSSTSKAHAPQGSTTLWQCHEDGSTPTMIEREIGPAQMFYLNSMWDESTKKWKSVAPGTPSSACRFFISDEKGSFDWGYISGGSVATGALLNKEEDRDTRYLYVPPEWVDDPTVPRGWVRLCPGTHIDHDYVTFTKGMEKGEPTDFVFRRDRKKLTDLLAMRETGTSIAESEKGREELKQKLKDPNYALAESRCSKQTGEDSEPRYCGLSDPERSKAMDVGAKLYETYPGLFYSSASVEE